MQVAKKSGIRLDSTVAITGDAAATTAAVELGSPYETVRKLAACNAVVVFSMSGCCMCTVAKQLLFGLGVGPTLSSSTSMPRALTSRPSSTSSAQTDSSRSRQSLLAASSWAAWRPSWPATSMAPWCLSSRTLGLFGSDFISEISHIIKLEDDRTVLINSPTIRSSILHSTMAFIATSCRHACASVAPIRLCNSNGGGAVDWLYLSNCNIQGTIPTGIGSLTGLIDLELADNNMTGEIPAEIGNLINLWQLEMYNNSFTGKLPVGLRILMKLEMFDASMNSLEGDLSELRFLNNLMRLQLFQNNLFGQVPVELGEFKKLVNLFLYDRFPKSLSAE
ncbi:Receptor-like protein kinase HAIKU2 [Morella rubra]|uniref:Receptor-like protein kinase HAIKU2 n=1 Tax=Morella rubra TaxID=262757 RepID=A0A6A1WFG3_9ROSI|nr:Receptor-like protein kinase HAIKU2 [Morella rubra]